MSVQLRARTIVLTLCSTLLATAVAALPARAEATARAAWEVKGRTAHPRRSSRSIGPTDIPRSP